MRNTPLLDEKKIHLFFDVSLWLKGWFALTEIVAGITVHVVSKATFISWVYWVMQDEFADDPHDAVANFILHWVQNISISGQSFLGFYLIGHGIIKLWLVTGLLRKRLWYYPTALVVFGLFIVYQLYRFSFTHSAWLLVITVLDITIVALTLHEYRIMRKHRS